MFFGGMRWGLAQMKYVYFPLGRWKTGKKKKNTIRLVLLPPHPNRKLLQENEEGNGDGDTVVVFLQRLMS